MASAVNDQTKRRELGRASKQQLGSSTKGWAAPTLSSLFEVLV